MTYLDSHCHFDFDAFDGRRQTLWQACQQAGVSGMIIPGVSPGQWPRVFALTAQLQGVYGALGLHPWWVAEWLAKGQLELASAMAELLQHPRCVAIGECGLDAAIELPLAQQLPVFETQLQLARDANLPVIIHARRSHNPTLELLGRYRLSRGGVIHGFSGSLELAQQYWRLGFRLGVGGTITYSRAKKTRRALAAMPLEALVLETDAPDMPLSGCQGKANSPLQIPAVAQTLAELRGQSVADIARQTTQNTRQLFNL